MDAALLQRAPLGRLEIAGRAVFLLALLCALRAAFAGEAAPAARLLEPYIRCDGFAGGVRAVTLDRRPRDAPPWRAVGFAGKTERVSVIDGYRVAYSYPRTLAFARLNAERSDPARYETDKRIVTENFAAMADADRSTALARFSDRGYSWQTLTKNELRGTTLGITQIFSDQDSVIVTIYFLNQPPEQRRFAAYEEFIALRDAFVAGYVECVARKRVPSR